jgi:hypothetical protein
MCHAIGATSLSFRMLASNGLGLMGNYDRQPCTAVPWAEETIRFSLSWSWWELCSVLRDVRREGAAIMLLHSVVMTASLSCVLTTGYMQHIMASHLTQELSTIFLNARLMLLAVRGQDGAHTSPLFSRVTTLFGLSFVGVRLGYAIPRIAVHLHAIAQGVQHHGWLDASASIDGCSRAMTMRSLVFVDVPLHAVQVGLNLLWATQIFSAAARRSRPASRDDQGEGAAKRA